MLFRSSQGITVFKNGENQPRDVPLPSGKPGAYLDSFLREIRGERDNLHLSSAEILTAARTALALQKVADDGQVCQVLDQVR